MEDPWASGPSWSTPAKPSSSKPPMEFPPSPPPTQVDEPDPWAPAKPQADAAPAPIPEPLTAAPPQPSFPTTWDIPSADGWGEHESELPTTSSRPPAAAAAAESAPASPTVPLPRKASLSEGAVWSLDSPRLNATVAPAAEQAAQIALPKSPSPPGTPPAAHFAALHALSPSGSPSHTHTSHVSHHSPSASIRSAISARSAHSHIDEGGGWGEPGLGAREEPLPSFSSPRPASFTEGDFGGFASFDAAASSSDPWGAPASNVEGDGGWGEAHAESSRRSSGFATPQLEHAGDNDDDEADEDEEEGEGWGRVARKPSTPVRRAEEEDWEEAQRRIILKEQRAPREKVERLKQDWRELAEGVIGLNKLEAFSDAEARAQEEADRKAADATFETLRSLSAIPPNINTYPPVLSSFESYQVFIKNLSRPNPTPSTSLLNVSAARRARRIDSLGITSLDQPFGGRSRLGEPEAPPVEQVASADEPQKGRWSFWGRKSQPEKPLVTSGGGVLQVKQSPISPDPAIVSSSRQPSLGSRPASPAISPGLAVEPVVSSSTVGAAMSQSPLEAAAQPPAAGPSGTTPAPSAVSRFWGRLRRNPSSSGAVTGKEVDADLELSADDFSFLDQVPSIATTPSGSMERGVGDLLAFEPGRPEEIASLESMLTSKPTPLPAPLAPPPVGRSRNPSGSSIASGSGRFVARMASGSQPPPPRQSAMDLLGGLDFSAADSSAATDLVQSPASLTGGTAANAGGMSAWDDFLSSSSAPPMQPARSVTPVLAPPPARSLTPSIPSPAPAPVQSPPIASPARPSPAVSMLPSVLPPTRPASFSPQATNDFGDFGDFGDFSNTTTTFTPTFPSEPSFASQTPFSLPDHPNTPIITATPPPPPGPQPTRSTAHKPNLSLAHDHTKSLLNDASAVKGRRWPAPPSPVAPVLEPPPSGPQVSNGFPFLSPPPPPRPGSVTGQAKPVSFGIDLLNSPDPAVTTTMPPALPRPPANGLQSGLAPTPPRSGTPTSIAPAFPLAPPLVPSSSASSARSGGKSGLSAQDLSFFDNL